MRILYSLIIFFDRYSSGFNLLYLILLSSFHANICVDTGTLLYGTLQFGPANDSSPRESSSPNSEVTQVFIEYSRSDARAFSFPYLLQSIFQDSAQID
jgi:hypothetical protein